jgi:hypothetical protein
MATFEIEWREQGAGLLTGSDSGITDEFYDVSDLDPDTDYEWRVRVTDGDWTDWELFQTSAPSASKIFFGSANISKAYLGSTEVIKIMLGTEQLLP